MSRIRSRDTTPERVLRGVLRRAGLRPQPHPKLPGAPDVAFVRRRVAIFLDGCFWHGCPQHYIAPTTRFSFWADKLRRNVERDAEVDAVLQGMGFRLVRLWQHELTYVGGLLARVGAALDEHADPIPPAFCDGKIWWACACGSVDVRVVSVSERGSLKPAGKVRPAAASLRCRSCSRGWIVPVPEKLI
ncbi:very short patch repair endonuclease [Polyangium fumosum]|uniref:Very short patch repair endonuclease n=2 Tax=Polyangium fumosum TaxID=889272 RepID=A0A4U1IEN5_9BACT|nr:very short patch repair endonuclease [Polyangium fumosum]